MSNLSELKRKWMLNRAFLQDYLESEGSWKRVKEGIEASLRFNSTQEEGISEDAKEALRKGLESSRKEIEEGKPGIDRGSFASYIDEKEGDE